MKASLPSIILLAVFLAGCTAQTASTTAHVAANTSPEVEKIEVYHFHATKQCYSCITVGDLAEETLNTYFAEELGSGKIVFGHINGELPENRELVVKYGATGSSIWIGTHTKDGKFTSEQNINVWYKIGNKEEYMDYLKGVIDQKLKGN
jgi:hypothetical protein